MGDLNEDEAREIEEDCHAWIVQPKLDGVRALLHVEDGQVRITSRCVSEVTYRLSEFQDNLPHLTQGLSQLKGTILDGELVCPASVIDTGTTTTATSLQADHGDTGHDAGESTSDPGPAECRHPVSCFRRSSAPGKRRDFLATDQSDRICW